MLALSSTIAASETRGGTPNLSVILGGAGATLEDMVGAYAAFARKGLAAVPRFTPDAPKREQRMMSEGAAFIVRDILETGGPIGRAVEGQGGYRGIAWKTGTSFGFRDAWAVGVGNRYTVGVWVGRPDGTPNPGFFGANVAAPLLADIFTALPGGRAASPNPAPDSVTQEKICWPLGTRAAGTDPARCPIQRTAWTLAGAAPPTFADRLQAGAPTLTYFVDRASGLRVMPDCTAEPFAQRQTARWPASLEPWLDAGLRKNVTPPPWTPRCAQAYRPAASIKIVGLNDGEVLRRATNGAVPRARLDIRGSREDINWMVNGRLLSHQAKAGEQFVEFPAPGRYDISAFDSHGRYDRISVRVD